MSSRLEGPRDGDRFGYSVALSYNGETLAVGAPLSTTTYTQSGIVRVYRISSGSWQLLGANIEGEGTTNMFGGSVSLSSDGNTVAIGGYNNGGVVAVTGNPNDMSGHGRVLSYLSGSWQQLGQDMDGEAAHDAFGFSVVLSADGKTVVAGGGQNDGNGSDSGHARVYHYSNGSTWKQIGADIDGQAAGHFFGRAVGISANGETVAISSRINAGYVRVYDLFETKNCV